MLRDEIDRVVEESSAKLLRDAVPPVRSWLLEYVLGKDREDLSLQRAFEECESYPPRVRLLETLRKDGTWPISAERKAAEDAGLGPPYGWTFITMLRNLYMLYEYRATRHDGDIEAAVERILSWDHEDGYIRGPEPDMIPRPHYNGLVLSVVGRYERMGDPRARAVIKWLLRTQRRDGGWVIPYLQDMKYLPEYKHMRMREFVRLVNTGKTPAYNPGAYGDVPSCIWSTVGALRGLAWHPPLLRNRDTRRGCNFVLDNFFRSNYHPNFNKSPTNWTVLKFPTFHGSGLTALDTLMYMGIGLEDKRMERPVRWLLGERSPDGLWYRSQRPHPVDDQLITVTALMVLGYLSNMDRHPR